MAATGWGVRIVVNKCKVSEQFSRMIFVVLHFPWMFKSNWWKIFSCLLYTIDCFVLNDLMLLALEYRQAYDLMKHSIFIKNLRNSLVFSFPSSRTLDPCLMAHGGSRYKPQNAHVNVHSLANRNHNKAKERDRYLERKDLNVDTQYLQYIYK